MRKLVLLFVLLLMPACVCAASAWKFVSPMPNPRYAHAACLGPDGKIYVMGGLVVENRDPRFCHMDGLLSTLVYDPKTDKWKYLTPVPGFPAYADGFGCKYDEKARKYVACNYVESALPSPLFIYKKYGTWNLTSKLVREHKLVLTVKCGGKVIRLPPGKTPNDMDWIRKTDFRRVGVGVDAVAAKDGRIWWIGGSGPWTHLGGSPGENIVLPYDPARNAWIDATTRESDGNSPPETVFHTKIPPMHEKRVDAVAVTASDGKIYVMGGYRQIGGERRAYVKAGDRIVESKDEGPSKKPVGLAVSDTMECYNPRTNQWEFEKPLSSPRMEFSAAMGSDNKIYVFGGFAGWAKDKSTPVLTTTEVYDPKTDTWSQRKPMPETRVFDTAVYAANGKIYVIGGSRTMHSPVLSSVLVYDPVKDSWERGPSMNVPRGSPAAVATPDGKIYVVGGTSFGAYPGREKINRFLPEGHKINAGKVQASVEVLNVFK